MDDFLMNSKEKIKSSTFSINTNVPKWPLQEANGQVLC